MKSYAFCFAIIACSLALQCKSVFGQASVPPAALNEFWGGVEADWMPLKRSDIWTYEQGEVVRKYCKEFAERHSPKSLVPAMIEDLARRPSEVNAFIYTWVVLNWNAKEVKNILTPFYNGNDPLKKQIASDFIASIEESGESVKP